MESSEPTVDTPIFDKAGEEHITSSTWSFNQRLFKCGNQGYTYRTG